VNSCEHTYACTVPHPYSRKTPLRENIAGLMTIHTRTSSIAYSSYVDLRRRACLSLLFPPLPRCTHASRRLYVPHAARPEENHAHARSHTHTNTNTNTNMDARYAVAYERALMYTHISTDTHGRREGARTQQHRQLARRVSAGRKNTTNPTAVCRASISAHAHTHTSTTPTPTTQHATRTHTV